jgi:hypothetical protein
MSYNPLTRLGQLSPSAEVNYLAHFAAPAVPA